MSDELAAEIKRVEQHRNFPHNTCPASRHVELMAGVLGRGESYAMIAEEPEHVAESLFSVVGSLYEARAEIARLTAEVERLTGENGALRTAFRINMLRFGSTHKEVDDVIRAALTPEGQSGGNDTGEQR